VPGGGEQLRQVGLIGGRTWADEHDDRRRVVRILRRAGYVARHRWARSLVGTRQVGPNTLPDWRYTTGPAVGRQAVDPWVMAERLHRCAADWYGQLRMAPANPLILPLPRLCGQRHVCPVCAALRSRQLAAALRTVIDAEELSGVDGDLAFVTLTQRAMPGESLSTALDRLRGGWRRLTQGRPGRTWRSYVSGSYSGIEATRGADGADGQLGHHWHVHLHVVLRCDPTVSLDTVRPWIGATWRDATEAQSPGFGWDPVAGGVTEGDSAWLGPWCSQLDDLARVYQACKYPTPVVDLHPVAMAEFVAAAHGRRWHQGTGAWRSVMADAEAISAEDALARAEADEQELLFDLGDGICGCAPSEAPPLDTIAPGMGLPGPDDVGFADRPLDGDLPPDSMAPVRWRLTEGPAVTAFRAWLASPASPVGAELTQDDRERTWVSLPAGWAHARTVETVTALRRSADLGRPAG